MRLFALMLVLCATMPVSARAGDFEDAQAALAKGQNDRAAELYARAVQADPGLFAKDDRALDARCRAYLEPRAAKDPASAFALGYILFHHSELDAAERAFAQDLALEKDPARRANAEKWLADVRAQKLGEMKRRALEKTAREREWERAAAASPAPPPSASAPPAPPTSPASVEPEPAPAPSASAETSAPASPAPSTDPRYAHRVYVGLDGKAADGVIVKDHWGKEILVGSDGKVKGVVRGKVVVDLQGNTIGVPAP